MPLIFIFFLLFTSLHAQTLYKTLSSNPARLNPLLATDSASGVITSYLFNGLVKYDVNGSIIGDLAQSFYFASPTEVHFKLRKNVTWHDGAPFTAKDVLFTFELLASDKLSTPYSNEFRMVERVEIVDNYHLKVLYKMPYYKALHTWMMGIVPKHLLENETDYMSARFNQNPVGTGPYKLHKLELSKHIVLKGNLDYFEHPPYIDEIVFSIVPDPTTNFYMLLKKEIDLNMLTPMQLEKKVSKSFKETYTLIEEISKGYTYLGFNHDRALFKNPKVREAIALGIDKQEIVDILFFGHGKPCYGPFLPGSFAYNAAYEKSTYNPSKAEALLKMAGFTKDNPLRFEITTNSGNSTRLAAAQIIQHQLSKIGIEVSLRVMEWQAFLNMVVFPKKFDAVILGWGLSLMPDAYSIWHSDGMKPGGFNFISYHNTQVDTMILEAESLIDETALSQKYQAIFSHIVEDNPYVFLYIPHDITAINSAISPIIPSIIGIEHNQIEWIKQ